MYFKYDPASQPAALKEANAIEKCCIRFKYEKPNTTGELVYMCAHAEFRCDIYTNWMLKNLYFYCMAAQTNNTTYETNPAMDIDPSIAEFPGAGANANNNPATPPAPASDLLFRNDVEIADAAGLDTKRSNDWAFHFFKQKKNAAKILDPKECEIADNISFNGFVRGWWFDRKSGLSQTGTAPLFLRVVEDEICMCPQCKEGFQLPD